MDRNQHSVYLLYYICAMRDTFISFGNYENRGKARTRYIQETLGEEGYVKAYQENLQAVFASGQNLDIEVKPIVVNKEGDGSTVSDKRAIVQKQEGLYAVEYHPVGGCPEPAKSGEIYDVIKEMDEVELRIAPYEAFYIINLTGKKRKKCLQ